MYPITFCNRYYTTTTIHPTSVTFLDVYSRYPHSLCFFLMGNRILSLGGFLKRVRDTVMKFSVESYGVVAVLFILGDE